MRRTFVGILGLAFSSAVMAGDPVPVSVHPKPAAAPVATVSMSSTTAVEGALMTASDAAACAPSVPMTMSVTPTVPAPVMKETCPTSCGKPLFGGTLLAVGCDVCESPGRPMLLGTTVRARSAAHCETCPTDRSITIDCAGESRWSFASRPRLLMGRSNCETCPQSDSACKTTCTSNGPRCRTSWWPWSRVGNGQCWMRFKSWLCGAHRPGPRAGLFRPVPCESPLLGRFPACDRGCPSGCFGGAGSLACRPGLALGRPAGTACADGQCGVRGMFGHRKGLVDCNGMEPQLQNTSPIPGYRFASIELKNLNSRMGHRDIVETVDLPGTMPNTNEPAPKNPGPMPPPAMGKIEESTKKGPTAAAVTAKPKDATSLQRPFSMP